MSLERGGEVDEGLKDLRALEREVCQLASSLLFRRSKERAYHKAGTADDSYCVAVISHCCMY